MSTHMLSSIGTDVKVFEYSLEQGNLLFPGSEEMIIQQSSNTFLTTLSGSLYGYRKVIHYDGLSISHCNLNRLIVWRSGMPTKVMESEFDSLLNIVQSAYVSAGLEVPRPSPRQFGFIGTVDQVSGIGNVEPLPQLPPIVQIDEEVEDEDANEAE